MTKYLKQFELTAQYEEYINSDIAVLPNISLTKDDNRVHYTPAPNYLKFTAQQDNSTIALNSANNPDIKYSLNGGAWTQWDYSAITLNTGDTVRMKGNNSNGFSTSTSSSNYNKFQMTGKISASGNIMSLLYEDNFEGKLTIPRGCCFNSMFAGCTSLTTAPELPATTLAYRCYGQMFYGCTSLTTAPELPATILADYCYSYMFYGCTGLTTAPKLPATILAVYCYNGMFEGCTNLTTAPALPATTLAYRCYGQMFLGCTSLTTAPELPATILADYCYNSMFYGCTGLTTAPELPATTLASYCYNSMFYNCTSLITAPELPATTLASYCYNSMFEYCKKLNSITCLATNIIATDCTYNWVRGVASSGTFTKAGSMTSWTNGTNGIPTGWTQNIKDYSTDYLTFVSLEDGTFTFTQNDLQYSLDNGTTWTTLAANTASPTIRAEKKILWKQSCLTPSSSGIGTFSATGNFDVQGNVMSLLYGDDFQNQTDLSGKYSVFMYLFSGNIKVINAENLILPATTLSKWCYDSMFYGCTSLTTAPELPSTTLASYCYNSMFYGCAALTTAPKLPATTLDYGCYNSMFYGCTSLTIAPKLPATILASNCYNSMFYDCTSLTTAPELPATTLDNGCYYQMFYGCSSLTTLPVLLSTILATGCYHSMFGGCTSLTTAPELPATTLADYCYLGMFSGCTSLTTAPDLPATTLANYCYAYMFKGCKKLNSITCLATNIIVTDCTYNWVSGVASSGTFTKAGSMTSWTNGTNGIPTGWTVQNAA